MVLGIPFFLKTYFDGLVGPGYFVYLGYGLAVRPWIFYFCYSRIIWFPYVAFVVYDVLFYLYGSALHSVVNGMKNVDLLYVYVAGCYYVLIITIVC